MLCAGANAMSICRTIGRVCGTRAALAGAVTAVISAAAPADEACAPALVTEASVAAIADERTLVLADGQAVRLAGLVAMADAVAPEELVERLERRARAALRDLALGHAVTLRAGDAAPPADRHGRIAGQLFVADGEGAVWIQAALVEAGLARVTPLGGSACAAALLAREAAARGAGRGLWKEWHYSVRDAVPPGPLYRFANTFQIVEGTVFAVEETGARTYVNFEEDWRNDFTVSIPAGDVDAFAGTPADPARLAGRRIRVRGWIALRGGPMLEATRPTQIEVLSGHAPETENARPHMSRPGVEKIK